MGRRRTWIFVTGAILIIIVAAAYATTAFTSGVAERSATVDVTTDRNALLSIQDCQSNNLVTQQDDQVIIKLSRPGVGPNRDARFEVGNPSAPAADQHCAPSTNPSTSAAFRIVNQGTQSADIDFRYEGSGQTGSGDLQFHLQPEGRNNPGIDESWVASNAGQTGAVREIPPGGAIYVAIELDTDDPTDLSGTLKVTAKVE